MSTSLDYHPDMLPACIAAVEARLKLCDAATLGPWEVSPMVDGATIGGRPHKVWPIDSPAQEEDEDGFCGIGCAVCILPREDETPETLRYVPANAAFIAAARTLTPALLRMELARLREHAAAEADVRDNPDNAGFYRIGRVAQLRRDTARCWAQMQGREGHGPEIICDGPCCAHLDTPAIFKPAPDTAPTGKGDDDAQM